MYYTHCVDPVFGKGTIPNTTNTKTSGTYHVWFAPVAAEVLVMADVENKVVLPSQLALYRKFEQSYLTVLPEIYKAISGNLEKEGLREFSSIEYLREHLKLILVNITEKPHNESIVLRYQFLPDEFTWLVGLDIDFHVKSNFFGD